MRTILIFLGLTLMISCSGPNEIIEIPDSFLEESPSPNSITVPAVDINESPEETEEPPPNNSLPEDQLEGPLGGGTVYIWNSKGNRSEYGVVDVENRNTTRILPDSPISEKPDESAIPWDAFEVTFSKYSGQLAYLVNDDQLSLWIADLELRDIQQVWIDESSWLDEPTGYEYVLSFWGPGDNTVFLRRSEDFLGTGQDLAIYSISMGQIFLWQGDCNNIGISPITEGYAIICEIDSVDNNNYGVVEADGSVFTTSTRPTVLIDDALSWVFSKDLSKVLVADGTGEISILAEEEEEHFLLVYRPPTTTLEDLNGLQWSDSGDQFLVYGYDLENNSCIIDMDTEFDTLPCWMLIDVASKEIIWTPPPNLRSTLDASLSPDGKWVVTSVSIIPDQFGVIISTKSNEWYQVYLGIFSLVMWEK